MALKPIQFMPGITVAFGGKSPPTTGWSAERHLDVRAEERPNGDVWFICQRGRVRVGKSAIAWTMDDGEDPEKPAVKR